MKTPGKKIFILSFLFILSLLISTSCKRQRVISLKTLLLEMTDRESLTLYPSSWYNLKQFSSYDRRSDSTGGRGWFANSDYTWFTGVDSSSGREEYILFDTDGPGAIVRWWMTFAGEGSYDGIVRVYIDDNKTPVIEDNILKVLSGQLLAGEPLSSSVSPETGLHQRGHNLYLPVPFRKHCRITYECDAIVISDNTRKPSIYYNICYRHYEKNASVISFSQDELINASAIIKRTNELLLKPDNKLAEKKNKIHKLSGIISSGDSTKANIRSSNSSITRITLLLDADNPEQALISTVLCMSFDGKRTVWVPSGDFFGTAYKRTSFSTWYTMVENGIKMESFWSMPFRLNHQ